MAHGFSSLFSAVDVTLDPETASGWLVLSPDRKKVLFDETLLIIVLLL